MEGINDVACNTQKKLYERGFNRRTLCWVLSKSSPVYLTLSKMHRRGQKRGTMMSQLMHLEMPKSTVRLLHLESVWMATTSSFSITMILKSLSVHWKYTWIEKCPMEHCQACNGRPKARNEGRLEIFQLKIKTFAVQYVRNAEVCKSMHLKMQWSMWQSESGRGECQRNDLIVFYKRSKNERVMTVRWARNQHLANASEHFLELFPQGMRACSFLFSTNDIHTSANQPTVMNTHTVTVQHAEETDWTNYHLIVCQQHEPVTSRMQKDNTLTLYSV